MLASGKEELTLLVYADEERIDFALQESRRVKSGFTEGFIEFTIPVFQSRVEKASEKGKVLSIYLSSEFHLIEVMIFLHKDRRQNTRKNSVLCRHLDDPVPAILTDLTRKAVSPGSYESAGLDGFANREGLDFQVAPWRRQFRIP